LIYTLYPNFELRARVPQNVRSRLGDSLSRHALDNSKIVSPIPPIDPSVCKYPSCAWPRRGYGGVPLPTDFSDRAKKILQRAGGLFSSPEEKRTVFFTGTLPGSTRAAIDAFALHSSWAIKYFFTKISQRIGVLNSLARYEWVWEFQKRGALHFHLCYEFVSEELAKSKRKWFRRIWKQVLKGVANRSGVDIFGRSGGRTWKDDERRWQTRIETVTKSVSSYLSKYLSKGSGSARGSGYICPTRWYGSSRFLLRELVEKTLRFVTHNPKRSDLETFSEFDFDLAKVLASCSERHYTYVDKYGSGVGNIYFLSVDVCDDIVEFLRVGELEVMSQSKKVNSVKLVRGVGSRSVRFRFVDAVLQRSWLLRGFQEYMTSSERQALDIYCEGLSVSFSSMVDIDKLARRYLEFQGVISESTPPLASEAGVDGPERRKMESRGGGQLEIEYPGLPF